MPTKKEYLDYVLEQLSLLDGISYKQMMGEYIIYYQGRIAAYVCDDRLLIKPVKSAVRLMPNAVLEPPYDGAKGMLLCDMTDDREFLKTLFEEIYGTNSTHNHQWLDENGWEYRKVHLIDKSGNIYSATLNIGLAKDGRKILYDINKISNIGHGVVPSASKKKRGSHINPDIADKSIVSRSDSDVKQKFSLSDPLNAAFNQDVQDKFENQGIPHRSLPLPDRHQERRHLHRRHHRLCLRLRP